MVFKFSYFTQCFVLVVELISYCASIDTYASYLVSHSIFSYVISTLILIVCPGYANSTGHYSAPISFNISLTSGCVNFSIKYSDNNFASLINKFNDIGDYHFYLVCGKNEEEGAIKIINQVKKGNCESLSSKDVSEIIYYIYVSNIFIGNDSFGHHVACQMNKPSFIIIIDTPKAYSDYSRNRDAPYLRYHLSRRVYPLGTNQK